MEQHTVDVGFHLKRTLTAFKGGMSCTYVFEPIVFANSRNNATTSLNHQRPSPPSAKSMSLNQLDGSQLPVSTADLAPNIPQELIIDILLRLPARSVGKFRCVSKPWRSLLSDPLFIKAHLTLHHHQPQKYILISSSPPIEKSTLSTLTFTPTGSADHDGVLKRLTLLENQLTDADIVGSCNGLVLVSEFKIKHPFRRLSNLDFMYYLINPTTMELVELPANPLAPVALPIGGAFGYDRSSDDYKVVTLSNCERITNDVHLDVFSLRSGTWRRIDVLRYRLHFLSGVFLNGAIHWLVKSDVSLILAFDLSCEELKLLPLPSSRPENCLFSRIAVLDGCLTMVATMGYCIDVWMMKGYGVEESWTKFSVTTQNYAALPLPICLLGDDDLVLYVNQKLVVHSLTGETRRDMLFAGDKFRDVKAFCESLVSPICYCQK
ncbi:F-box/kelch-repeat protein At3g23880-like [Coffea arabica]|uniref:F-box/kelch-repeat protein At3g23880-like n=1 Tax=Coffea arabica TaxID=13443 RepID=A0ABM4U5K3_COFAR